jgi:hypothetical protein
MARADSWTDGRVGKPDPRSRYWSTPDLAMRVTASAAYFREEELASRMSG